LRTSEYYNLYEKNKFLLISLLFGCSTMTIPGTKEPTDADINEQAAKAYLEVKAKSKISSNKEWNNIVQRVAKRIALASGENFQWETILIESSEINAWCMPGGKMAVYTGIMPVLKTEAALAAVMGHEVAHATLRHGKQRYARAISENFIGMALGGAAILGGQFFCKTDTCKALTALGGAAAGFAITFFDRKFSRGDESAADREGQMYMARAGYDPSEAPKLWDRMNASHEGSAPPEFMSTHPSDERRKAALNSWMGEAQKNYSLAPHHYGLGENIK
jgi:predicted Zn-dependent protease